MPRELQILSETTVNCVWGRENVFYDTVNCAVMPFKLQHLCVASVRCVCRRERIYSIVLHYVLSCLSKYMIEACILLQKEYILVVSNRTHFALRACMPLKLPTLCVTAVSTMCVWERKNSFCDSIRYAIIPLELQKLCVATASTTCAWERTCMECLLYHMIAITSLELQELCM